MYMTEKGEQLYMQIELSRQIHIDTAVKNTTEYSCVFDCHIYIICLLSSKIHNGDAN